MVSQLVNLLGPDYANYKIRCPPATIREKGAPNLDRLKVRLRCVKNSEYSLAKCLKLMQETQDDLDPTSNVDFTNSYNDDSTLSSAEEFLFSPESRPMSLDSLNPPNSFDVDAENTVSNVFVSKQPAVLSEMSTSRDPHGKRFTSKQQCVKLERTLECYVTKFATPGIAVCCPVAEISYLG